MEFIEKATNKHTVFVDCRTDSRQNNCRRKDINFSLDNKSYTLYSYCFGNTKEFTDFMFVARIGGINDFAILIRSPLQTSHSASDFEFMKFGSEQCKINSQQNMPHMAHGNQYCSFSSTSIAHLALASDNQFLVTIYWNDPQLTKQSNNLSLLMNNSTFSDVEIEVENETIHAHKCILCNSSPVFKTMLSESNKIVITDASKCYVTAMLNFLYQVPDFDKYILSYFDLCKLAQRFEIDDLVSNSFHKSLSNINEDNCLDFYHFAIELNNASFKLAVMNWMRSKRGTIVRSNKQKIVDAFGLEAGLALIEEIAS